MKTCQTCNKPNCQNIICRRINRLIKNYKKTLNEKKTIELQIEDCIDHFKITDDPCILDQMKTLKEKKIKIKQKLKNINNQMLEKFNLYIIDNPNNEELKIV